MISHVTEISSKLKTKSCALDLRIRKWLVNRKKNFNHSRNYHEKNSYLHKAYCIFHTSFPVSFERTQGCGRQSTMQQRIWGLWPLQVPPLVTDWTRTKAQLSEYSSWVLSIFFHVLKYVRNGFLSGPLNTNKMPPLYIQMHLHLLLLCTSFLKLHKCQAQNRFCSDF